jgi:uncharacterized protein YqfA (UPF0365 family)
MSVKSSDMTGILARQKAEALARKQAREERSRAEAAAARARSEEIRKRTEEYRKKVVAAEERHSLAIAEQLQQLEKASKQTICP